MEGGGEGRGETEGEKLTCLKRSYIGKRERGEKKRKEELF